MPASLDLFGLNASLSDFEDAAFSLILAQCGPGAGSSPPPGPGCDTNDCLLSQVGLESHLQTQAKISTVLNHELNPYSYSLGIFVGVLVTYAVILEFGFPVAAVLLVLFEGGLHINEFEALKKAAESIKRERCLQVVRSRDPNEKVGSLGSGVVRYVSAEEPLRYAVFFENESAATAPARQVIITDELDPTQLDLSTFSFGPLAFGDQLITPDAGLTAFATRLDLRPKKNLIVDIDARLDPTKGVVTWRFTSLDPVTGQPPDDPQGGFLPPNINQPEGEGSLLFTVMPKTGLPTNTQIRNRASIVFDANPPIPTPEWVNAVDNSTPTSRVLALAPQPGVRKLHRAVVGRRHRFRHPGLHGLRVAERRAIRAVRDEHGGDLGDVHGRARQGIRVLQRGARPRGERREQAVLGGG